MGESTAKETSAEPAAVRKAQDNFHWQGVEQLPYKEADAATFKSTSRQTLFSDPRLPAELRYFEIAPGGFSTLERHAHMYAVMVLRGEGHCLVGNIIHALKPFMRSSHLILSRSSRGSGISSAPDPCSPWDSYVLSMPAEPQLPSAEELAQLKANPTIETFLMGY